MSLPPPGFRSESMGVRLVCVGAVILVTFLVLVQLGRLARLPKGYAAAQSKAAGWLVQHRSRWTAWKDGTTRDLAVYIPVYLGYGLVLVALLSPPRGAGIRIGGAPWVLYLTLVGTALADVAETLLFRASLSRLVGGAAEAEVANIARVTQVMTGLKAVFAIATLALLVVHVGIRGPSPSPTTR